VLASPAVCGRQSVEGVSALAGCSPLRDAVWLAPVTLPARFLRISQLSNSSGILGESPQR